MSTGDAVPALEVRDIRKSFGAVQALRGVSFALHRGEVVGLVGDNGAGKSTVVKCVAGTYQPDDGEILLDGEPVVIPTPERARELGIETVWQDLNLIEAFDAAENLFLNREIVAHNPAARLVRWLNKRRMYEQAAEVLDTLRIRIPSLREPVVNLSGGQRQSVAVGRAVAWGRHIVMMDEPAAALGVEQSEHVLDLIQTLAEKGVAVLFISHNMQHVLRSTHRVVVLRHGEEVGNVVTAEVSGRDLVAMITGASLVVPGEDVGV